MDADCPGQVTHQGRRGCEHSVTVQAVRELTGLVEGANALLSGSKGLETKYLSLPSYASQRLSLALEADPNAVRVVIGWSSQMHQMLLAASRRMQPTAPRARAIICDSQSMYTYLQQRCGVTIPTSVFLTSGSRPRRRCRLRGPAPGARRTGCTSPPAAAPAATMSCWTSECGRLLINAHSLVPVHGGGVVCCKLRTVLMACILVALLWPLRKMQLA